MKKHQNDYFQFLCLHLLFFIAKLFPLGVSNWLGQRLGALSFGILKARRDLTLENIRNARKHGFLTIAVADEQIAQKVWQNLCLLGLEFAYYRNSVTKIRQAVILEGKENLERVLAKKRGVILITLHLGNWELMGMALSLEGFKVNSIAKTQTNGILNRYINDCRRCIGINPIPKTKFLRPVLDAFKRNESVAFFIDQADRHQGIPIEIFGQKARVPRGAAEFALKLDKPVVFVYITRESLYKHRLVISEEIPLIRSGNYENDLLNNTAAFTGLIQSVIQRYPEQWLWMHKFWDTKILV